MKSCFVISPIGREGSETRQHADDVFDYIIRPAMEDCGIQCRRSDHLHEPGKISEQMFREIYTSDVCVALLTERNPNVYYELALAQAWNRPVIILIEKDDEPPFDIRDQRCVAYDLKPRNLFERVFVNPLIAHLKSLEQLNWKVPSPFGEYGSPTSVESAAVPQFFSRFSHFGGSEHWVATIAAAQQRCDLMSLALDSWKHRHGVVNQLVRGAESGCEVRLLQMHPDNPMLYDFGNGTKAVKYLKPAIQLAAEFYRDLAMKNPRIQFRQIRHGCAHSRIIILDDTAFVCPYLYHSASSPLWRCDSQSILYQTIGTEFDTLWAMNGPDVQLDPGSSHT